MRKLIVTFLMVQSWSASAAVLSMENYLDQVKARNPEAQAVQSRLRAAELKVNDEPYVHLSPELYSQYGMVDNKMETMQPSVMGTRTEATQWRVGLRKETRYGLGADVYFNSRRTAVSGVNPLMITEDNYVESQAVLELRQSLWRNGFGEVTRSELAAKVAVARAEILRERYLLKELLLRARQAYWSLVSYQQIVKLQEENVGRAKRLYDWMRRRSGMRLVDDVEVLQAQAAFESRQLELQSSRDEQAQVLRQFNTLRGSENDSLEALADLPKDELMLKESSAPAPKISREDFDMLRAQADAAMAEAKAARSKIRPQLDLAASFASNGRDQDRRLSYREIDDGRHPSWSVMLNFSIPLDYRLIGNLKQAVRADLSAAASAKQQADYQEKRVWSDLLSQRSEAQKRFAQAVEIERIQTQLVSSEHRRLANGRTTTFQTLSFEQNLSLAQVQRVRSQLALMQVHNVIRTFAGSPQVEYQE